MRNWSTNIDNLKKYPEKLLKFQLESLINFGLNGKKINKEVLQRNLSSLQIDSKKSAYLSVLLKE